MREFDDLAASNMNSNDHADGYFSSSDSSLGSWPSPPRNAARKPQRGRKATQPTGGDAVARATKPPPQKNGAPNANQRDKENKDPRLGNGKKERSKSLNNASSKFGRGCPYRHPKFRGISPRDKPMILSRRLSYRINNSTPDKSPITAVKLHFTPTTSLPRGRKNRHTQSSLERLNDSTSSAVKKYSGASKRNSV